MNLYRLGAIPCQDTQAIYHVLTELRQEGLVLCRPTSRFLCLGMHDDLEQEVDRDYCQQNGISLIRREIGGGVVLLDQGQVFFQLVIGVNSPLLKGRRDRFFRQFLAPVVATLADFGLQAMVKDPADVIVNGKKISGNGAGDSNGFAVYTGNILLRFDRRAMAGALRLPDAEARKLVEAAMVQHLTTLEEELGVAPASELLEECLLTHFGSWLGECVPAVYSQELQLAVTQMATRLTAPEFVGLSGRRSTGRKVKICEGVYLPVGEI